MPAEILIAYGDYSYGVRLRFAPLRMTGGREFINSICRGILESPESTTKDSNAPLFSIPFAPLLPFFTGAKQGAAHGEGED